MQSYDRAAEYMIPRGSKADTDTRCPEEVGASFEAGSTHCTPISGAGVWVIVLALSAHLRSTYARARGLTLCVTRSLITLHVARVRVLTGAERSTPQGRPSAARRVTHAAHSASRRKLRCVRPGGQAQHCCTVGRECGAA